MTSLSRAKDLAVVEPRGLDAELEGYAWIPRMLDKARATLAGTNGPYHFGCPVDHTCMARLGVSPGLILELAGRCPDDADVLHALQKHGIPSAREAWFDGQAVEDELQGPGWYLRVEPAEQAPMSEAGETIVLAPGARQPPSVSATGEVVEVSEGEVTFFLGEHQARIVGSGETVWIPAGVEWWFHHGGAGSAVMRRFQPLLTNRAAPTGLRPSQGPQASSLAFACSNSSSVSLPRSCNSASLARSST